MLYFEDVELGDEIGPLETEAAIVIGLWWGTGWRNTTSKSFNASAPMYLAWPVQHIRNLFSG